MGFPASSGLKHVQDPWTSEGSRVSGLFGLTAGEKGEPRLVYDVNRVINVCCLSILMMPPCRSRRYARAITAGSTISRAVASDSSASVLDAYTANDEEEQEVLVTIRCKLLFLATGTFQTRGSLISRGHLMIRHRYRRSGL